MKAEIWLFLKRSFPVSFELVRVSQIEEENKNVAFSQGPIPPPRPKIDEKTLQNLINQFCFFFVGKVCMSSFTFCAQDTHEKSHVF